MTDKTEMIEMNLDSSAITNWERDDETGQERFRIKLNPSQLEELGYVKLEDVEIDLNIFKSVVSEFPPTINEDSKQPEWCSGELDRCYDFLMSQSPLKPRQPKEE